LRKVWRIEVSRREYFERHGDGWKEDSKCGAASFAGRADKTCFRPPWLRTSLLDGLVSEFPGVRATQSIGGERTLPVAKPNAPLASIQKAWHGRFVSKAFDSSRLANASALARNLQPRRSRSRTRFKTRINAFAYPEFWRFIEGPPVARGGPFPLACTTRFLALRVTFPSLVGRVISPAHGFSKARISSAQDQERSQSRADRC
jgi:hypothetical protein